MILNHFPDADRPDAQWWFQFNHQQSHDTLTFMMRTPATSAPLANYLLDPASYTAGPGPWAERHQQAHDDAARYYGVQPSMNLADEPVGTPFWTWMNWTEHVALTGAALAAGRGS